MPGFPMLAGENVMIMWVLVPGAMRYRIYQDGEYIGENPAPPFTTPIPAEEGVYKYNIRGVDEAGTEGPVSKEGVVSIVKLIQPEDFNFFFKDDVLNIGWSVVPRADTYDIYKTISANDPYDLIACVAENRYVDSQVKLSENAGETFYYKIVSKDKYNRASADDEFIEVNVEKENSPDCCKEITLKIMRTKHVQITNFYFDYEIKSFFDTKLFNDKETMVYTDPISEVIAIIDKYGDRIMTIGEKGPNPDQFGAPFKLGIDEDDNVYVTDSIKDRFFAYDSDGELMYSAKSHLVTENEILDHHELTEPFKYTKLGGIVIYDDKLYIVERLSGTILLYDKNNGEYIDYFRNKENNEIKLFPSPVELLLDKERRKLYVSCSLARKILVVNIETGEDLYVIGMSKSFVGAFMTIEDMAFDKNGDLIVSDSVMHSVQVFSKDDGEYMYHIGDEKAIPDSTSNNQRPLVKEMKNPEAVNIDEEGRLWIYVGSIKGFMVREYIDDDIWDSKVDEPEGECK
jgi:hypothetical protein